MPKAKYAGSKQFTFPWYYKDWLSDSALRKCSPTTRGIWVDLLCLMFDQPIRGQITGTEEELMRAVGCTEKELQDFFSQIFHHNFCEMSRNGHGIVTLTNRKMYRAEQVRNQYRIRKQRERTKKNVTLLSQDNRPSYLYLCLYLYPPPRPFPPLPTEDKKGVITPLSCQTPRCPVDKIVKIYHQTLPKNPQVRTTGTHLKKNIGARWKEYPDLEWWESYFRFVGECKFLTGRVNDWSASLSWLTGPKNIEKVLNNEYHSREQGVSPRTAKNLEALRNWSEKE